MKTAERFLRKEKVYVLLTENPAEYNDRKYPLIGSAIGCRINLYKKNKETSILIKFFFKIQLRQ